MEASPRPRAIKSCLLAADKENLSAASCRLRTRAVSLALHASNIYARVIANHGAMHLMMSGWMAKMDYCLLQTPITYSTGVSLALIVTAFYSFPQLLTPIRYH